MASLLSGYEKSCREISQVDVERLAGKNCILTGLIIPFGPTISFHEKITTQGKSISILKIKIETSDFNDENSKVIFETDNWEDFVRFAIEKRYYYYWEMEYINEEWQKAVLVTELIRKMEEEIK